MRPTSNVYRIVDIVNCAGSLSRHRLIREIERLRISRNAPGAVASLLTNAGNAYGRIFVEKAGLISIHPERAAQVRQYWQPIAAFGLISVQEGRARVSAVFSSVLSWQSDYWFESGAARCVRVDAGCPSTAF